MRLHAPHLPLHGIDASARQDVHIVSGLRNLLFTGLSLNWSSAASRHR
jgi:hypothetical protein